MPGNLAIFRYLDNPVGGWRVVAVPCGTAADIASITVVLTPNRYTSTARVRIEPPAGSDPRGATAVSPIYLESIKLSELVAWRDRLFFDAIDHFKLPRTGAIERLKRSVRKATTPRNTKGPENFRHPAEANASSGTNPVYRGADGEAGVRRRRGDARTARRATHRSAADASKPQ